jgi:hypothetical protein
VLEALLRKIQEAELPYVWSQAELGTKGCGVGVSPAVFLVVFLVPKLRLGTQVLEALLRKIQEAELPKLRSQAELGTKK